MKTSDQAQKKIHLPRRYSCPVRVRITQPEQDSKTVNEYKVLPPFSIGYGKTCEIKLPKGKGPDRLFEFAPSENSKSVSLPLKRAIDQGGFEIFLDGESVTDSDLMIEPGSSVRILDKNDRQEVELSVEYNDSWKSHLMSLYSLSVLLFLVLGLVGYFVYLDLQKTEQRLDDTESRLAKTESSLSARDIQFKSILDQFDSRQIKMEQSLEQIDNVQKISIAQIRTDFATELKRINNTAQDEMSKIARTDEESRNKLRQDTRARISSLETSMSERLIKSTDQFKSAQNELFILNTARIDSLEQQTSVFKNILLESQEAVVFIKTNYLAESLATGEQREMESFGTGFVVDVNGLAIAPQHVMRPWLYDDNMLAMQAIGLVKVLPESVYYTIWTAREQVVGTSATEEKRYLTDSAFGSNKQNRGVMPLFIPEPVYGPHIVASPMGAIQVQRPLVGHTDVFVFQLIDVDRIFSHLVMGDDINQVEAMDEIILVGYPLSRLHDGKAIPQGVKGFVRRLTNELLELDTALHPGSSGAPVLDRHSKVIGMAVALVSSDTYGVAVPVAHLKSAVVEARLNLENRNQTQHEKVTVPVSLSDK